MREGWILHHLWLIPILPLIGAAINGFFGYFIQKRWGRLPVAVIACTMAGLSFFFSVCVWIIVNSWDHDVQRVYEWYTWMSVGSLDAKIGFLIDPLSTVMMLVVTGVGFLIHVYSKGYMDHDKSTWRFFCYLNLFLFAMLILVMGENLLMMFIGWEGVGLCSYLLIGFWYQHKPNTSAGNKAFIVNRIGDFGFILGMALLFWTVSRSPILHQGDFLHADGLLRKLQSGDTAAVKYVHDHLSAETKGMLENYKEGHHPSIELKSAIAHDLNHLMDKNLSGVAAFKAVSSPQTEKIKAQSPKDKLAVNRSLLADAFNDSDNEIISRNPVATVRFHEIFDKTSSKHWQIGLIATLIGLFLFIGATGKSAQIPLYVWLPDAMAGPTPVSALIHAATMVTSGIYMIGRLNSAFTPQALTVVAVVGGMTAFFAATIAITQNDIKKVLAYSTVSQLGYMFLGMGVGAFAAGIFHLVTHAFFKGLLFLGSGSVIHAMSDEQDMRKMGGLKSRIPITYVTFLVGTLAIAGFPLLSGFFSKDEILFQTWTAHNEYCAWLPKALWTLAWITAGITSFYMFRLLFMTFYGENRADEKTQKHIHESPRSMTVPLMILAFLSAVAGFIGVPDAIGHVFHWENSNSFHHFLAPVLDRNHGAAEHGPVWVEFLFMGLSVGIFICGFLLARMLYLQRPELPGQLKERFARLYNLSSNKYFVDELYEKVFVNGVKAKMAFLAWFDQAIIDRVVNDSARATNLTSKGVRVVDERGVDYTVNFVADATAAKGRFLSRLQTGTIQAYFYSISGGMAVTIAILYYLWH